MSVSKICRFINLGGYLNPEGFLFFKLDKMKVVNPFDLLLNNNKSKGIYRPVLGPSRFKFTNGIGDDCGVVLLASLENWVAISE